MPRLFSPYDFLFTCTFSDVSFPSTSSPRLDSRADDAAAHLLAPRLPLEVAINIIEEAAYDSHLDAHLLKQCALVCRDWSVPAQKLLFSSVSLATERSCAAFTAAVDRATPRGRMLGDASTPSPTPLPRVRTYPSSASLCMGVLRQEKDEVGLPDVLRMQRPAPSFDETTLDLFKAGPRIRALQFSNWSENHDSIIQLLDVWPSLKSLRISGTPPKLPQTSLQPFPAALEELRMNFQTSPNVDFAKWLLHNSTSSLRCLELEREPSSELLDYLVEAHGDTLRSLALPVCTSHHHTRAVQKCTQLRELRVESPFVTPLLYKHLPGQLQHVALTLDSDTTLQPVIDALRTSESLKAVTLHVWESGERNPKLPVLKLGCAYHGIDLTITKDIRLFRSLRADHV
ncbi:hypothetical protein MSAN_02226200 [Mycena sanguinolenta]|uniref:F-box domain-containing protein n=1 Tax=Mycena sanguinolenta TaxID=230812 RepID=A0A8H6XA67_9AGAR|nr:hypothetical protein MSAN_02226200 [Mycena sanguinolenta]